MARHATDRARVVAVVGKSRVGAVAVRQRRGSRFGVFSDERVQGSWRVVGQHRQPNPAGACIEIVCVELPRPGLICSPINNFHGARNNDLRGLGGIEERFLRSEWNLGLVDFDHAFQKRTIRIDHRAAKLLRQKPSGLVGDAKLVRVPTYRWSGLPTGAPPRTRSAAAAWSDAGSCRRSPTSGGRSRDIREAGNDLPETTPDFPRSPGRQTLQATAAPQGRPHSFLRPEIPSETGSACVRGPLRYAID